MRPDLTSPFGSEYFTRSSVFHDLVDPGTDVYNNEKNNDNEYRNGKFIDNANSNRVNQAAIILLDFQNEFVKKGGKLHGSISKTMEEIGVLERIPKLIQEAR